MVELKDAMSLKSTLVLIVCHEIHDFLEMRFIHVTTLSKQRKNTRITKKEVGGRTDVYELR